MRVSWKQLMVLLKAIFFGGGASLASFSPSGRPGSTKDLSALPLLIGSWLISRYKTS